MAKCELCGNEYDKAFTISQSGKSHVEKAAERADADGRWDVCIDGFTILVGWIHFLHERLSGAASFAAFATIFFI